MKTRPPKTLLEAVRYFADPARALARFVAVRWPNGVACPRQGCGSASVQFIGTRKRWRCKECKRQFSATVGTVFEQTHIGLDKWLPAVWLLANTKNGTSSHELGRALGVTQKTAWFMLHRVRESMKDENPPMLAGEVEADETFVGGKHQHLRTRVNAIGKNVPIGGPAAGKTTVFGMVQRRAGKGKSRARAMVVPNHKASASIPHIYDNVVTGSTLYTDALRSYRQTEPRLYPRLYRPKHRIRQRARSHEHHRKLLVVREAHAARDVYCGAPVPPQCVS